MPKTEVKKVTKTKASLVVRSSSKTTGEKPVTKSEKRDLFSAPVFSLAGKAMGVINLPKEVFGNPVNASLLAQAIRVYSNNIKGHFGHTKTRGEVHGTTAKVYAQKGTGRARHGARTAPIFKGGGVAFGPKFRIVELELPKKMKKAALLSALAQKTQDQEIIAVSDLSKASGKTKEIAKLLKATGKKSVLIVSDKHNDLAFKASRNIPNIKLLPFNQINVFEVIKYKTLILSKESIENLASQLKKGAVIQ